MKTLERNLKCFYQYFGSAVSSFMMSDWFCINCEHVLILKVYTVNLLPLIDCHKSYKKVKDPKV